MRNILTMSRREITRLRARFSGKSRIIVLAILALTIVCSYVIYHQDLVISKGLYNVGVSAGAPFITDSRFNITEMQRETGYELLRQERIDVYLDDDDIVIGHTERAEYAAGALKQYLEKQELLCVAEEYEMDRAFPLRIEVSYIDTEDEDVIGASAAVENQESLPPNVEPDNPVTIPEDNIAAASPVALPEPLPPAPSASDDAVRKQLAEFAESNQLPEFKAEFVSENDIIIPSLMNPPFRWRLSACFL